MQAVAIFLPSGVLAGAEQLLVQVAREYHRRGYQVHFFLLTSIKAEKIIDVLPDSKVHICNSARELVGVLLLFFKLLLNSTKFKYIYTSHVHLNGFVGFGRRIRLIKTDYHIGRESTNIFARFKSGRRRLIFDLAYKHGYKHIDFLVCQTESMKRELLENKPFINADKTKVLQNPVTIDNTISKLANPLPGKKYLVAAGRLITEKGFDVLIDSMPAIVKEYPDFELVILGDGGKRKNFESQINDLSLTDKVHLLGWQDDVYPFFKYAQACVVSSRHEGFPNVLLQMMMCNDAVVSTKCSDGIEAIDGIYICEVNDTKSLTEKIILALRTDNSTKRAVFASFLAANTIDKYLEKIEKSLR